MTHGSLFSGIGGFDLASQWMGWDNVFQVEWDEWCRKVLAKNFPSTERYGDIKEFDGTKYRGKIDILTGGFPCQPFSHAGKRQGGADDRYLWPEYLRVIREVKPTYVVGENVAGLISMENVTPFEKWVFTGMESKAYFRRIYTRYIYRKRQTFVLNEIIKDLEREGYTVETFLIPACGVGAWHRRDRIWIVAYTKCRRPQGQRTLLGQMQSEAFEDRETDRFLNIIQREARPYHNGDNHGISKKLDESRIKGLGNAIVPQVAYEIFKAIDLINT